MANVIQLKDGSVHTVFDERDTLQLIGSYMGFEIQRLLEECLMEDDGDSAYIDDLEKETDALRTRYKEVMAQLRQHSEAIAALICEKEIDRKALSSEAGSISVITWREINR